MIVQFVATPIHLLGLDLYNRTGVSMKDRLSHLGKIYINSVALRMLRFLPAYGIGGVVNIELRKYLLKKEHWAESDFRIKKFIEWTMNRKNLVRVLISMFSSYFRRFCWAYLGYFWSLIWEKWSNRLIKCTLFDLTSIKINFSLR